MKPIFNKENGLFFVRMKGVEPPRLAALDPKSSVSTNSTIPACLLFKSSLQIYSIFLNTKVLKYFSTTFGANLN